MSYDDSNWREEYKGYTSSRYELDLLENGPKSLSQSWMMGALHSKWKKMKGYKDPEPPIDDWVVEEPLTMHEKMYRLATQNHSPWKGGGSENFQGGSENVL